MYTDLVIDDSASMRSILKDMINSIEDFEVIAVATDAYDAREKIKEYEPDLVTIDINMPKMDGVTFLRNLMRLHPMPAVVISGESVRGNDIFDDGAVFNGHFFLLWGFAKYCARHTNDFEFFNIFLEEAKISELFNI